ncbi:MAG: bacterial Ig-like domain-containing protein [Clostridia bacterium]|nr:bacterial Ig-like domain-containing protein [Clostridia bacterium]
MKNISKLLLIVATVLCMASAFVGCGEKNPLNEICIEPGNAPQTTVVQGNDLDLSKGSLTLVKKNGDESVAFTDQGVSITGYDKTQLGKQTLTVTYGGKTTTLDVTVIPRIVLQNVDTNYFVGDQFNYDKGQLRIAKDDGSTFTVMMNNEAVSIEGFNSESAASGATVTVKYQTAGVVYESTFQVNIFAPESVTMSNPIKTNYKSHESLDLYGAYFTVKANGGQMEKYVDVTNDLTSGYNPSAVTIENRTEPVEQIVTVTYLNHSFTFKVKVVYSGVSIMRQRAAEFATKFDWTQDSVTIQEEDGLAAIDAMQEYFKLSNADRAILTEEEVASVVRVAAVYARHELAEEAKTFENTFTLNEKGAFSYVGATYEDVSADYERLLNPEEPFIALGKLARDLTANFSNLTIAQQITVGSYLANVYSDQELQLVIELNKLLLELYESLKDVPTDWTQADLASLGAQIGAVSIRISASSFKGSYYTPFFEQMSSWREKNDFFDIVYSYYFYHEDESRKAAITSTLWDVVPQPKPLQDLFITISSGLQEVTYIAQNTPLWFDTSLLMLYYRQALEQGAAIKNSENQLHKDLYNYINYDNIINQNLRDPASGYIALTKNMFEEPEFEAMWNTYLDLVDKYFYEGLEFDFKENGAAIAAMFKQFVNLSPAWQQGFINSLFTMYDEAKMDKSAFEFLEVKEVNSYFMLFLANYYLDVLPDETVEPLFQDLLYAIEKYATRYKYSNGEKDFKELMSSIQSRYDVLSSEDKEAFDDHIGFAYEKYMAIAEAEDADLGEWASVVEELCNNVTLFNNVNKFLSDSDVPNADKAGVHVILFSVYENSVQLYQQLTGSKNADVLNTLITKGYPIGKNGASWTIDYAMARIRDTFIGYMVNSKITVPQGDYELIYMAWDLYKNSNIATFLASAKEVYGKQFNKEVVSIDTIATIAAQFRALKVEDKAMFNTLDADVIYYAAMEASFAATLSEAELEAAKALIAFERAYCTYIGAVSEENLTALTAAAEAAEAALTEEITSADNYVSYLKDMYEYLLGVYTEIKNA